MLREGSFRVQADARFDLVFALDVFRLGTAILSRSQKFPDPIIFRIRPTYLRCHTASLCTFDAVAYLLRNFSFIS